MASTNPPDPQELIDLSFRVQERKRPDRHPYQIGCLLGVVLVAFGQMFIGIPHESTLYGHVSTLTIDLLDALFIIGGFLGLVGALMHRDRDPRLSLRLGMFGQFAVFCGMISYAYITVTGVGSPTWLAILSAGLGIGLTYASAHRMLQQRKAIHDLDRLVDIMQPPKQVDDDR